MFLGFREGGSRAGPGPGSRGAVIKADSAVIFTAHCITALRCIPHTAQLLEIFCLGDCAAERGVGGVQSLKQEGHIGFRGRALIYWVHWDSSLLPVASESAKCNCCLHTTHAGDERLLQWCWWRNIL